MVTAYFDWPNLTDEERAIRDLAREVAEKEIAPRSTQHDIDGTFVRDSIDALAEAGLLGVNIPKEYGGLGGSQLAAVMALEAISAACGSTGAAYNFHLLLTHMMVGGGPEELRQKYLPDMAKRKLGAMAFNEGPFEGFGNPFDTTTQDRGDHLLLNGNKRFVTSAGEADVYVFSAQSVGAGDGSSHPLLSQQYVLVDKETPGVSTPELYNTMGLRGASNGRMKAENAPVPKENIISGSRLSLMKTDAYKDTSAVGPQVVSIGLAGGAFDAALQHTRKVGQAQWKTQALAEMVSRLDAMRYYHYVAARTFDVEYKPVLEMQFAMKRLSGDDAVWICERAIDIIGGPSVFRTSPVQRACRDARVASFLMHPPHDRRERLGDELYKLVALKENEEPRTMDWEPVAEFAYLRASGYLFVSLPDIARRAFARSAIEQYVRSRGEDRVTIDNFGDYLAQADQKMKAAAPVGAGGPPGGFPPGGFPGGFPPGGGPPGGFPGGGPPGGFPPGGFPPGGPPGGFPPGGFPPGGFPPGGFPPGGGPPGGFAPGGGFPPGGFPPGGPPGGFPPGGPPGGPPTSTSPATDRPESEEESPKSE